VVWRGLGGDEGEGEGRAMHAGCQQAWLGQGGRSGHGARTCTRRGAASREHLARSWGGQEGMSHRQDKPGGMMAGGVVRALGG